MNIHGAALAWHDAGACVLPAAADGSKRPALPWDRYKHERPTRDELGRMLWPDVSGIGIVCGTVSGNVEMFEAEATAVEAGLVGQLMEMLPEGLRDKLNTYVERSPKGGVHWIFRVDGVPVKGNTKLARHRDGQAVVVDFETRGEGGWTVIAPSNGPTHPTGKPWQVVYGSPGVIPLLTAEEYRLLHACAATFDAMPEPIAPIDVRPSGTPWMSTHDGAPGDDFETKATWDEILIPAGWTKARQRGQVTEWVRPGKSPRDGISATTGWQGDWFYVFSTSTEFEAERTYTKFGTYAVLHHGGDFQSAARALRQAGYGAKPVASSPALTVVQGGSSVTDERMAVPGIVAQAATGEQPSSDVRPTWARTDLTAYLDGTFTPQVPELFRRSDGKFLLYRGRVHSFHGESESGKSWVALHAAAETMFAGEHVAMIDFESDAHTVVGRLLLLGVPPEVIAERFDYRRPEVSPLMIGFEQVAWADLLAHRYGVVIIDGVTEALAVFGVPSKDNDEVTKWIRTIPREIATKTGAAVIDVDHVTKDPDTRGRFAIGGQAKMAALDGAAYVVEVIEPLGVGLVGRISLRVAKDRPGGVRPISGMYRKTDRTQETAVLVVDSSVTGKTEVRVEMPRTDTQDTPEGARRPWRPTGYMERISRALELANACMSRTAIKQTVTGDNNRIYEAIDYLIEDGYVTADGPTGRGSSQPTLRLIKPYRESSEPVCDLADGEVDSEPVCETRLPSGVVNPQTGQTGSDSSEPVCADGLQTGSDGFLFDPEDPNDE